MTEAAKQELAAEFMEEVESIAEDVDDGSLPREDLISEGYLGIMKGIALLDGNETRAGDATYNDDETWAGDVAYNDGGTWASEMSASELIRAQIRQAMLDAQEAHREQSAAENKVIAQVELLNDAIDRLTEELGTKPNIDEIANELGIPQNKVLDILKLTGETPDDAAFQNPDADAL